MKTSALEEIDWTFSNVDTKYLTHGLHPYPARMIPQIPSTLLEYFKREGIIEKEDKLYDPFCGSGTSLVEARLHGLHGEGNDINPFACLLSLAKSIPLRKSKLEEAKDDLFQDLADEIQDITEEYNTSGGVNIEEPDVNEGWFPKPPLYHLVYIRDRINDIEEKYNEDISRFLRVALSKTARLTSYQRNGEFKRYRIPKEDREDHNPDVLSIFKSESEDNLRRMKEYIKRADPTFETIVHCSDSRRAKEVESRTAHITITSPPYGDHSTTVAYGQFSRDPAIIAGNYSKDQMRNVDKIGLGGSKSRLESLQELEELSPSLRKTLETLRSKDGRSEDATQYFRDYFEVMKQVKRILKAGQPVVWVVANRTMSRVNIPNHLITRELCEHLGFNHMKTLPRSIPNKTMPWKNAPENIAGKTGNLMAKENIVILNTPD